jgi:hypothetical protein
LKHAADPEVARLIELLGRIQQAGGLGMRLVREKEGSGTVLFFPPKVAGQMSADVAEAEQLLDMASCINVPATHVAEHRAAPGFADVRGPARGLKPLIRGTAASRSRATPSSRSATANTGSGSTIATSRRKGCSRS